MGKVIWSPSAEKDVDLIAEFIARDLIERAALFVINIMENTERLEKYPLSGRLIPEMNNENCRELIYGSYRIMYRLMDKNVIRITGVVNSARDWKSKQNI
ncbi:MAG: hypothetical protein A2Y94_03040 [Caldithrix sp. RBG_13_44_9]|nr:MAG: hypothetical protein A2Y94_03040 [Caldithrix sp. RBG_13_44_9]